jgi:hypothetical protein
LNSVFSFLTTSLDYDPPIYSSHVARITGAKLGVSRTFYLGWPGNHNTPYLHLPNSLNYRFEPWYLAKRFSKSSFLAHCIYKESLPLLSHSDKTNKRKKPPLHEGSPNLFITGRIWDKLCLS